MYRRFSWGGLSLSGSAIVSVVDINADKKAIMVTLMNRGPLSLCSQMIAMRNDFS